MQDVKFAGSTRARVLLSAEKLIAGNKDQLQGPLRPVDLGRTVGISAQSVRRYETWGAIPPATRTVGRQRRYGRRHVDALGTLRHLQFSFGWQAAVDVMRAVGRGDNAAAFAKLDERHASIHGVRISTLAVVDAIRDLPDLPPALRRRVTVSISEAARRADVPASSLRFWEQQGLLSPARHPSNGYRLYDEAQVRRAQVIALLRRSNRTFPVIRNVLATVDTGDVQPAIEAGRQALADLDRMSSRCVEATAALWTYLASM